MNALRIDHVHIRWAVRADLLQMLKIEQASFAHPWGGWDFDRCFDAKTVVIYVAERRHEILGYTVYQLMTHHLELLNLAVRTDARRHRVGSLLVSKVLFKLHQHRRDFLGVTVSEPNLTGQLFFRALGFKAVGFQREQDSPPHGYRMEFRA